MKKIVSLLAVAALTAASCSTFASGGLHYDAPSKEVITWAYNNGITKYDSLAEFNASAPVTREQAAKMIISRMRSNNNLVIPMPDILCVFNDESSIDASLLNTVQDACAVGLFKGYKGAFMPNNYIPMSDVQTLIARASNIAPQFKEYVKNINLTDEGLLLRGELIEGLYNMDVVVSHRAEDEKGEVLAATAVHLDNARKLRAGKNIGSYTLTQTVSCFCTEDYRRPIMYQVHNGAINGAQYADLSGGMMTGQYNPMLHTVEDAFGMIQEAIDNRADNITVQYDATLGYPISLTIDRSFMIADEEQYYTFALKQ